VGTVQNNNAKKIENDRGDDGS